MDPIPIRGRGASDNPRNRFETLAYFPDPEARDPDDPGPRTRLLRDPSRSIIARNDSPDIPFDASVNPYRGCEHGCVYCIGPDTPILYADMTWKPIGAVRVGDVLVGFDEDPAPGRTREYRKAEVQRVWWSKKPTLRMITRQSEVITTADHRWLQSRDFRWSRTVQLSPGRLLWRILFARELSLDPEPIEAIEPGPVMDVVDIQTSTGTFFAAGLATHNCYARPTHEYLGFSAGLDFETKILVKEDAPELLRHELSSPRWRPQVIAFSGVTDPYQPAERRLRLTRRCLEVLAEFRNPAAIVTKNHLVTRDADVLADLARSRAAVVNISITTLDETLQRLMEPRTSIPARRLAAIEALAGAGVPVRVLVAPVVPGLTDHELPGILDAAARAGATGAGYIPLRLPLGVAALFERWLEQHFPERKNKVLNRIRALRGGKLNDARFGSRMRGDGLWAEQLKTLFGAACRKAGLDRGWVPLSTAAFGRPGAGGQLGLFDGV